VISVACCYSVKLCTLFARVFQSQQRGIVTRMWGVVPDATFTKRKCNWCGSLQNGGDDVAISQLALHWNCNSPRMGCVRRATHNYMRQEQAIIEWSCQVFSNVSCCHSLKLCALAAQAFRLQRKKYTSLCFAYPLGPHENDQKWTCSWI